jgi:anti-sigma regulatory factor (Ser/Thr protein kinase)
VDIDEPDPFVGSPDVLRLPSHSASVSQARTHVKNVIKSWGATPRTDPGVPTSEVVTNAIVHARSQIALRVRLLDGQARIEVHDADAQPPELKEDDPHRTGGHGMRLVDALAACWGITAIAGDGKIVWFDIDLEIDPELSE